MSEVVAVGIIGAAAVIIVPLLALVIAQLARLNRRLRVLEHRDRLSWLYIRSLIDHAYRHNATPLPEPPDGWLEETPE